MRFVPGDGYHTLDGWTVADGGIELSVWNEKGDITASVRRPDGTHGRAFGGPAYPVVEFRNTCEHVEGESPLWHEYLRVHTHGRDLTAAEKRCADALVRRVGWDKP